MYLLSNTRYNSLGNAEANLEESESMLLMAAKKRKTDSDFTRARAFVSPCGFNQITLSTKNALADK